MANSLKNEENHGYAAICFTAMAKYVCPVMCHYYLSPTHSMYEGYCSRRVS